MVQKNTNFFQSNKLYYQAIRSRTRNLHHLGTLMFIFATLVVVAVSLIACYFVLQITIVQEDSPPSVSSLAIPLALVLLTALTIGSVFGSIVNYSIDTLIYNHVTVPLATKLEPDRKAAVVDDFLASM